MLSIGIQQITAALHSYNTLLRSDFGVLGHLWSQNDGITSRLRLTATSNCFLHSHETYTKSLSTLICCPLAYSSNLTQLYPPNLYRILGVQSHLRRQNDGIMSWLRLTATSNCLLQLYYTYTKSLISLGTLTCCPLAYISSLTQLLKKSSIDGKQYLDYL